MIWAHHNTLPPSRTQVALLDPTDNEACLAVWRLSEKGQRIRVSARTGRELPLPLTARHLDDLTDPQAAARGPKDTPEDVATKVTFDPTDSRTVVRFEDDLSEQLGLTTDRKPFPTYWY